MTLKINASYISCPLCYIINKAVLAGKFPSCMKYSTVTPIYKQGDKNCANFRPISLLTSFSKVFEKIICRKLLIHVYAHDILTNDQLGFSPELSTETASYNLINNVLAAINIKKVGGIFFYLKAINCVNHEILLYKLKFDGIPDSVYLLLISYLENRCWRVIIKN
jgi:hypothetical protein